MTLYYRALVNQVERVVELNAAEDCFVDISDSSRTFAVDRSTDPSGHPMPRGFTTHPDNLPNLVQKHVVMVAGTNANGEADFHQATVFVTQIEYDLGEHYDRAEASADEAGFEGDFVCFDQHESRNLLRAARQCVSSSADEVSAETVLEDLVGAADQDTLSDKLFGTSSSPGILESARLALLTSSTTSGRNLDVILGALRWFQSSKNAELDMSEICDIVDPDTVSSSYIDVLAEQLNFGGQTRRPESYSTLVLSTAHFTVEDNENLNVDSHWIHQTDYGFRIKLHPTLTVRELEQVTTLSDSIKRVFDFALASGYRAVEFDRDADALDELPTFDW